MGGPQTQKIAGCNQRRILRAAGVQFARFKAAFAYFRFCFRAT